MKKNEPQKKATAKKTNDIARAPQVVKATVASKPAALTHAQIAERAYSLWQKKGRPQGQDMICWLQAEAELKAGK